MRISHKLTLATVLGITVILAVYGYVRVLREVNLFESDMRRDHEVLAPALALAATVVAERDGLSELQRYVEAANTHEEHISIRWVSGPLDASRTETDRSTRLGHSVESHLIDATDQDPGALVTRVPVQASGVTGHIELRESLTDEQQYIRATVLRVVTVLLAMLLMCAVVIIGFGWLFVGRPLQQLVGKVKRVGDGDLSGPLSLAPRDEMRELAEEINAMCERIASANEKAALESARRQEALNQLRHAERLSTIGKLASGVAHEIGTPLNVVNARAKMIARGESQGAEALDDARVIAEQSERIAHIIRQLLDFARGRKPHKNSDNLVRIADGTKAMLERLASARGVTIDVVSTTPALEAQVDSSQIQQVLTNLVMNAIDAIDEQKSDGRVTLSVGLSPDGSQAVLEVRDTGTGMEPDVAARVFEPFFTTKDVGRGTGLGLSVAHGIVLEHGGTIEVESTPGQGSRFVVMLPVNS